MTEEIKEILDNLYRYKDEDYMKYQPEDILTIEDVWLLLDYITNLQQENEKLKYNARGQVNDYFKDKYADEVLKNAELQQDLDKANDIIKKDRQFYKCRMDEYIDLKKENEELKQTLNNITINGVEEENTTVLDLINENKKLKECYCNRTDCSGRLKDSKKYDSVYQERDDYKSRFEKALNEINKIYFTITSNNENYSNLYIKLKDTEQGKNLLNILNGSDKNERRKSNNN